MYHFISGLPRSGSTLLAAILRQNPDFHAGIISPLGPVVTKLREAMSPQQETHLMWSKEQRTAVLRAAFDAYYYNAPDVVFDNNRRWCLDANWIARVFPGSRIICCVRPIPEIIASFEKVFRRDPTTMGAICGNNQGLTVFKRVPILMEKDGVVGYAYEAFRDAWFGPGRAILIVIEYEHLTSAPDLIMAQLHDALTLPRFKYDFGKIEPIPGAAEFDRSLGIPGLHTVRPTIKADFTDIHPLPPDILSTLPPPFWR